VIQPALRTSALRISALSLSIAFSACATEPDDTCISDRRLAANRLAANRLAANGLLGDALTDVALTSATLGTAIEPDDFSDPFTRSLLEYTVSCALAPDQSVEVDLGDDVVVFRGALALAPQWGESDGVCDDTCQGWVSACLIARTNAEGESVEISLLGAHPGLDPSAEESDDFTDEEATYYGDLFAANRSMFACVPAGATAPTRTCGTTPATCAIEIVGTCETLCDAAGCRDGAGNLYAETITVNGAHADAAGACE